MNQERIALTLESIGEGASLFRGMTDPMTPTLLHAIISAFEINLATLKSELATHKMLTERRA